MSVRIVLASTEDVLVEVPTHKIPAVLDELNKVQVKWDKESDGIWSEVLTNGEYIYEEYTVGNLPVIASITGLVVASVLVTPAP